MMFPHDIAITTGFNDERDGHDVLIVAKLAVRMCRNSVERRKIECYLIEFDGRVFAIPPQYLRKRPPMVSTADEREYAELIERLTARTSA